MVQYNKMERLNKNSNNAEEGTTGWEQMSEMQQKTPEQLSRERQERKTIAYFISGGNPEMISASDVAISDKMRDGFLKDLAAGEYGEEAEVEFLNDIRGPIDQPENGAGGDRIFGRIMDDPWQKQLFGFCVGVEADQIEDGGEAVRQFLQENEYMDLTTPVGFEKVREHILGFLEPQVGDQDMSYYIQSMDDLGRTLYGKKFEYYQVFEGLREKAAGLEPGTELMNEEVAEGVEVFDIEEAVGEELLRRAKIDGDIWAQDGYNYQLSTEALKDAGLAPSHQMMIDGQTICLSDLFRLQGGRSAAIAYIPTEDGNVAVRGYYRSNSQGTWRYLPDYVKTEGEQSIGWYGKGPNEEAMTLPFEIQAGLSQVEQESGVKQITSTNPDFLLAGTAKHYSSKDEYREKLYAGQMRGDYYEEVDTGSWVELFAKMPRRKRAPEELNLDSGVAPDFSRKVLEYKGGSALVGETQVEVFESGDGRLNYLICSDSSGRSWVGGVETKTQVTSTGLRYNFVTAGDLATPLYEYASQANGYGDALDTRGVYQGMWQNYLSRIPIIQEYQKVKGV